MAGLYSWVGNIAFYLIFITVVTSLLPNKKYERYLKLFTGMVLILLVLKPLTGSLRLEDKIAYYFESITFQNESEDLKKELLGMEQQRLRQMIGQYENAVAKDVEAMAEDMGFYPQNTDITIEGNQESQAFGTVTHIRMQVSRKPPDEEGAEALETEGASTQIDPVERIVAADGVEPVQIGAGDSETAVRPDETLNRLRRKVEGYYGLETADVEIKLAEGEG